MDFTHTIRRILLGDWTAGLDGKKYEIRACDDLDECYTIKTTEGSAYWINNLQTSIISIEQITSPERGIIEVKVRKSCPRYNDHSDDFLERVAKYFYEVLSGLSFRTAEKHCYDKVDASYMDHNSEGDEIGWVEKEDYAYIGTTYIFDGPTFGEEEGFTEISEDAKQFIIRKLEAIFGMKGAWCEEKEGPCGMKHYTFKISNF